jgi:hypothetical protein
MLKVENLQQAMKKIISLTKKFGFLLLSFVLPLSVSAFVQTGTGAAGSPGAATQPNGAASPPSAGITSIQTVLNYLCLAFDWAFWFLIALAVLFGVIAAFRYLTAAGEPEQVKKANSTLLYAAIAVAVALLAKAIPLIVGSVFGVNGSLASC